MKNIVVNDEYRPSDLKPDGLLERYVALLYKDVQTLLPVAEQESGCPACGSMKFSGRFEKFGLPYKECADCQSLYAALRPADVDIARFYCQAPSKIFWRDQLSEASRKERKAHIIKPRFEWIADSIAEHLPGAGHWMDVHTGQARYLQAMAAVPVVCKSIVYPYCAVPADSGVGVIDKPWWEFDSTATADVVTLFEVLDHTQDTNGLLAQVKGWLKPGGLCFITAILASGFDVKVLGPQARNIYPPDRLNVFSVKGLQQLLQRHGFECLEFSTPGVLDLDIVAAALKENAGVSVSPFVRELALNSGEHVRRAFSEFLQENLLSSYGRILIRKA